ncbi:MAG: phosphoribosylformylglycinamidine synthase subunit PurL [Kosmotoga sp.]|uniref:phosphoribosylformylglycinamidine synthase subunit PurL n=1 Tax=Kosmotoga sp. TaxID=1955248 RepID=UPI001D8D629D|nr:phosphoribosylformylglycinamidine synthase subunit PurL [Kosmotoga sp.]MBO8167217.1 phosphoribosylformylglycinamidine synthase subunit PurL [Kosmotoga sp.]
MTLYEMVGLTSDEYELIVELLGREPNELELNMYGVMWSEHCSYKHSRSLLKEFPTSGTHVLQGPGENAGIVDIGNGLAIAMKIESHNHPSAIEPYQGAATGVGGIIRDIFTMGARPIALLNSLRFGNLDDPNTRYLFEKVVQGIGDYGNCVGIPTVGGEVCFNNCYKENPLVNAMCVGLIKTGNIKKGTATGIGNPVMLVGSTTGRDGMGGASFASVELSNQSLEKRSAVQVGDPFMEKLLLEACLELFETDSVVGIQDLGAAGLTSACSETASRGNSGIDLDVAFVPKREEGMSPVEVMISESQERMLVIVKKGNEAEVERIFNKWGLHSVVIGHVTGDKMLTVRENGTIVARVPAKSLAEAPVTHTESKVPSYLKELVKLESRAIPIPENMNEVLLKLLASPNITSKEWVYQQYDYMVRTNTVVTPGSDAAVISIRGTNKAIALTTDCNGRYCFLNPKIGSAISVAEAARNLVCTGAKPLAITDGLNFGNPESPEVFWQFEQAVKGISEACRILGIPVISGNVSFYNESESNAIYPTPIIGMAGLIENRSHITTPEFKNKGDVIVLIGENKEELGGSEYLKVIHGLEKGEVPQLDLEVERRVQAFCLECIADGLVKSAHDCSDGGLAVALAESCISGSIGAELHVYKTMRTDALLFGESQSRIIISIDAELLPTIIEKARTKNLAYEVLGTVTGQALRIYVNDRLEIDTPLERIRQAWREALKCAMGK